uniref:Uncharacterized protein n=1 Tax=Anopheles farauti TaxID=69004 RepID=A0A182Q485_9DIPT
MTGRVTGGGTAAAPKPPPAAGAWKRPLPEVLWPLLPDAMVPSKEETFTLCTLLLLLLLIPAPPYDCPGAPLHTTPGGFSVGAGSTWAGAGRTITLSMELSRVLRTLPVALPAVLLISPPPRVCFFFLAKSYMSPKMPANVLRRFFIVSSASSTTDGPPAPLAAAGAALPTPDRAAEADETPDTLLDCDALRVGARSDGCSGGSPDWLLKLPCRPIEPTPGVVRSGIGGGPPPTGTGRVPIGTGGASSVGLVPRDEIELRETAFVIIDGRQTFCRERGRRESVTVVATGHLPAITRAWHTCMRPTTRSAIWRRSSSWLSPISGNVESAALMMNSLPSFETITATPHTSMPPNSSDTCGHQKPETINQRAYGRGVLYFSVIGICSSMAEPWFVFQLPEMDFLLQQKGDPLSDSPVPHSSPAASCSAPGLSSLAVALPPWQWPAFSTHGKRVQVNWKGSKRTVGAGAHHIYAERAASIAQIRPNVALSRDHTPENSGPPNESDVLCEPLRRVKKIKDDLGDVVT